jgi:hypothetical protein
MTVACASRLRADDSGRRPGSPSDTLADGVPSPREREFAARTLLNEPGRTYPRTPRSVKAVSGQADKRRSTDNDRGGRSAVPSQRKR